MSGIEEFLYSNWIALISTMIAISSFLYTVRLDRKIRVQLLDDKLRPHMITLRNQLRATRNATPSPKAPYHHYVAQIGTIYEQLESEGLDIVLDKRARDIKDLLRIIESKLKEIAKACEPKMNAPDGYWVEYGRLLAEQNYMSDESQN